MRARLILALLGAAVTAPVSTAQQMPAPLNFPVALGPPRSTTISFNQASLNHLHPRSPGAVLLGSPFLYADYPVEPFAVQTPPPQVFIVQPTAAPDAPPETKSEPLLIELQGSRYVRFGGLPQSAERGVTERGVNVPPDFAVEAKSTQHATSPELPAAVLIFRDGHREQVHGYAIAAGVLYAQEDYLQNGQWTKNIQLSALNLPATARANRDNGVKFTLPSAPNEVVVGP
jgi:hypothetical protein